MIYKYGKDVPEFVLRYRDRNNLSQNELAALIGVTGQYVSNVERGVYPNPSSFCCLLLPILKDDESNALIDLMVEAQSVRLMRRLKK